MKVILATGTFPPEVSGQATFVSGLHDQLRKRDIDSVVVAYGDPLPTDAAAHIIRVPRTPWRHLAYALALRRASKGAAVIYAQDLFSSGLPSALVAGRTPLVIRLGGDFLWEKMVNAGRCEVSLAAYYEQPKRLDEKWYLALYRFVLGRCRLIIFNTEWQRALYQNVFHLVSEKTLVIQNPTPAVSHTASIPTQEMLYAGRLIPLKNLKRLVAAFSKVATDVRLVLIGDGPQRAELSQLAQEDMRVSVVPSVPRPAFLARLAGALALVVPSLSELNPNVVIEALALGVPVVLTSEVGLSNELKARCVLIDPMSTDDIATKLADVLKPEVQQRLRTLPQLALQDWDAVAAAHHEFFSRI